MFWFPNCLLLLGVQVLADYDCICNYNVEKGVYAQPNVIGQPIGYMYEFDCKPTYGSKSESDFLGIQFERKEGYVQVDAQLQRQICAGDQPLEDKIIVTTAATATEISSIQPSTHATHLRAAHTTETDKTLSMSQSSAQTTAEITAASTTTTTLPATSATTPPPTTQTTASASTPTTQTTITTTMPTTLPSTTEMTEIVTSPPIPITLQMSSSTPSTQTSMLMTTPTTTPTTTSTTTPTTTITIMATNTTTATPITSATTTHPVPKTSQATTYAPTTTGQSTSMEYGTGYIGVGYKLLQGNPYGEQTIKIDPGILSGRHIFKLTPNGTSALEVVTQHNHTCINVQTSHIVTGSKSYQNELFDAVRLNFNNKLNQLAFTLSSGLKDIQRTMSSYSGIVFKDDVTTCKLETIRQASSHSNHITITPEFASAVCSLPLAINDSTFVDYMSFLDHWGTNIIKEVEIGRKTVQRYQISYPQLYQRVLHQDSALIQHGGPVDGYASSLVIDLNALQKSVASHGIFGTLVETTAIGSVQNPEVVGLTLAPISEALDLSYWRPIMDELNDICPDTENRIKLIAYNIITATEKYPDYKNHVLPTDTAIQIPLTWPAGTYGLMEAAQGCPGSKTIWYDGYVFQDTADLRSHNAFASSIQNYLKGRFDANNIQTHFCIKTNPKDNIFNLDWPSGNYCILKRGECPAGFGFGFIYWDDEDIRNTNTRGGQLPDGQFDSNTKIYYCCRSDGSVNTQIALPTDRPFVLIRFGPTCQSVYAMNVAEVYIHWDDYDTFNKDSSGGMHPFDDGGPKDHTLHFCHYHSPLNGPAIVG